MSKKELNVGPATEDLLKDVGHNLRLARYRRGLSASQVADRAGISRSTLQLIESGESNMSLVSLVSILHALKLDIVDFFRGDDPLGRKLQDIQLLSGKTKKNKK
ncbi:helix-turn-helix domain-containing protein [Pseudoflavitalea rhizosphaerae]|uniref:helix-turn-helix domain-containing protein n=1 Tax=Pseudoflavitalea rhizosphaerae TaxID=1884793 RepID=UPI000F8C878E|nr:helix-turn-helix transcriptional regulator [Pseudoflavitalea rhizosphaerae]